MAKKNTLPEVELDDINFAPGVSLARKMIWWWLPLLYLLVSDTFYLRTYDSAQVKITLLQMGGITLIGMWASLLLLEGRRAFHRKDFVFLAPFLVYLLYVVVSFLHAPYKGPSVDDFVRYIIYMSVTLMVIREFTPRAVDRITKILIITAYIAVLYGLVQFLDWRYFPHKEQGPGLDPFVWRGAFGPRVFSTYGNPNFFGNFLVIIFPISITQFLKRRSVFLLPLVVLNLACLYWTETKGAFIGFGLSTFLLLVFYGYFFMRDKIKSRWKFLLVAALIPLGAAGVIYSIGNPASYSFRVNTWLSTWEMIESRPLSGIGVGTFKVIYPTYRRPAIFHIEGKHNTETDHAEEEHLEQWSDNGLVGFGIYIWMIAFVTIVGLRALGNLTEGLKPGERPPLVAYDILGYLTAFLGMLAHNFTDVSMRFVSSGIFLGLLPGVVIVLARGHALWELHYKGDAAPQAEAEPSPVYLWALWLGRAVAIAGLVYTAYLLCQEFAVLQGPLSNYLASGEILQWYISWLLLLACVAGAVFTFGGVLLKGMSAWVPVVVVVMLFPLYYFWGWFKGDVDHNMAIYFSKQGKWADAITYYEKVNSLDKYFVMPYYFTGNVFNDRFNMEKSYQPEWGDKNGVPRDDFERAMAAYEKVREVAPNYVQMHHQVGTLYMKMYEYLVKAGKPQEAAPYLDMAMARLNLYENLDPVYDLNYYRKAQIDIMRRDFAAAEVEYLHNINAWKCYVPGHRHETPEAYTNLANVQYAMAKYSEAYENYQKALKLDPNYAQALRNIAIVKGRVPAAALVPLKK
jgi:tetratricopeptide (TPR) repeat protein/O-antigen ligase